jgi:proline racemase
MNKIILRAITAYSRTDLKDEATSLAVKGREVTYGGKQYVILEGEQNQTLVAMYRCMNRGELKRLKR